MRALPGAATPASGETAALDALLSPIEQTERRIGATRFTLRACPACRATDLARQPVPGLFAPCRRCHALAARQRHVTVRAATSRAEGLSETRAACEHCHTIDVTWSEIPRLRRPHHRFAGGLLHGYAYQGANPIDDAGSADLDHMHHPHGESSAYDPAGPPADDAGDLTHEDCHASHATGSFDSDASSGDCGDDTGSSDGD